MSSAGSMVVVKSVADGKHIIGLTLFGEVFGGFFTIFTNWTGQMLVDSWIEMIESEVERSGWSWGQE